MSLGATGGSRSKPGVFTSCLRCRFRKKGENVVALSRTRDPREGRSCPRGRRPAFRPPLKYISALKKARNAFNGQGPEDGLELIRVMTGSGASTRAAARSAIHMGASDESGRAPQHFASVLVSKPELVREALFPRGLLARRLQRAFWYTSLGLRMCASIVSSMANSCLSLEEWLQSPPGGQWPLNLSRSGIIQCVRPDCEKRLSRKDVGPRPGCAARTRRVLRIIRGISRLARRVAAWGDPRDPQSG